jgi:AcrR family transcriptional regulator
MTARGRLSEAQVVGEAERMVDEVGVDAMTMTALAERLGVRQPSLYKHVSSLENLRRSMSVRAKLELAEKLAYAAVGRSSSDALVAVAHAYRSWAKQHPGRYALVNRAGRRDDEEQLAAEAAPVRVMFDILRGYRLPEADMIDATRMVRAALHGFVQLESSGGFGLPEDVDQSFGRLVSGLDRALLSWTGNGV